MRRARHEGMALPEIPLLDVETDWPTATLEAQLDRSIRPMRY